MKAVNKVVLLGNVCNAPEVRVLSNGIKVAQFSLATSSGGYTKQDGSEVKEKTQFHRIVAWRGLAEVVEKLIHKGDSVCVQGSIEYNEGEKNGVKVTYTDIVSDDISLCHSRQNTQQTPTFNQPMAQPMAQPMMQPMPQPQPVAQRPQVQQVWDGTQYVNAYQDPATGQWIRV